MCYRGSWHTGAHLQIMFNNSIFMKIQIRTEKILDLGSNSDCGIFEIIEEYFFFQNWDSNSQLFCFVLDLSSNPNCRIFEKFEKFVFPNRDSNPKLFGPLIFKIQMLQQKISNVSRDMELSFAPVCATLQMMLKWVGSFSKSRPKRRTRKMNYFFSCNWTEEENESKSIEVWNGFIANEDTV